jgi:hypothetical protein
LELGIFPLLVGCILIPAILALTGLVVLRIMRLEDRAWAAPLAGAAVWCVAGTYALMTRTPPWAWCLGVLALVVGIAIYYRSDLAFTAPELGVYALVHAFTLGLMSIVPFPGMWLMGGDWLEHYRMASAVWTQSFAVAEFPRSPSFAAGAILCLPFRPSLAADQIYVAATTAAAMLVLLAGASTPAARARRRWAIACLALSAFYVVHLQNLWPKWLAAGFFVAAILEALRHRERGDFAAAALAIFWFGVGVAAHEATALAAPFLLVAFGRPALAALARQRTVWLVGCLLALLTFGAWQTWTLVQLGWRERFARHPAATWHDGRPLPAKVAINAADHFVGLLAPDLRARWTDPQATRSVGEIAQHSYYTAIALHSWMAATLLTIFGPTLWVLRSEIGVLWREWSRAGAVAAWGGALAVTLLLNCLLGPTPPRYGLAQAGLVPVCLLGFVPLVLRLLDRAPAVRLRRIVRWHVLTGFGPFVLLALGVLLATHLPSAARAAWVEKLTAADRDLWTLRHLGLVPLSEVFFPLGILFFVLAVAAFWSGAVRVSGHNVRARRAERTG